MKKHSKLLAYTLNIFIVINASISIVSADIAMPRCKPGETPDKNFCSNPKVDNKVIFYYSITGGIVLAIIISGVILFKIREKNVK